MIAFLGNDMPELEVCNTSSDEESPQNEKRIEDRNDESPKGRRNERRQDSMEKYNSDLDSTEEKAAHEENSQDDGTHYTSDSGSSVGSWKRREEYEPNEAVMHYDAEEDNNRVQLV